LGDRETGRSKIGASIERPATVVDRTSRTAAISPRASSLTSRGVDGHIDLLLAVRKRRMSAAGRRCYKNLRLFAGFRQARPDSRSQLFVPITDACAREVAYF